MQLLQLLKMPIVYGLILSASLSIFLLYIIGASHYLTDHDENTCDMTYMFEYPQYVVRILHKGSIYANFLFIT